MIEATNTTELINALQTICGINNVFADKESLHQYGHDETEELLYFPEVVVKPSTTDEISLVLQYCNQ